MRTNAAFLAVATLLLVAWSCGGESGPALGEDVTVEAKGELPRPPDGGAEDIVGETPDVEPSADVAGDAPEPVCADSDGDGYGDGCAKGPDCNDGLKNCHVDCTSDANQNGVPDCEEAVCADSEIPYNGVDDDCDPFTSDMDVDKDGHDAFAMGGEDCDDDNPQVHPEAQEVCGDWLDNNCDGFPIPGSNQPECAQGQTCNLQTGACEDDPECNGCPMGQVCQNGTCEVDETCYGGCPEKQKCTPESGLCVIAGCLEEPCPDDGKNWACNPYTGFCYISSCEGGCPEGELCSPDTGKCYVDTNCAGECMMNETCNQYTGTCELMVNCPNDFCWGWPEGMWRVEGPETLFYVDQYEWTNKFGDTPTQNIDSLDMVQAMCFGVAKRPCTVEELSAACDGVVGPEGSTLPYAQSLEGYDYEMCNTEGVGVEDSGAHPGCRNEAFEVWDLVGNLAEWTQQGTLFGGSYDDGILGTCSYTVPSNSLPILAKGFRCCVSPDDDLDGDGYTAAQECDDSAPGVHPGADEKCNEIDDDCNGLVDDAENTDGDDFNVCQEGAECDKKESWNPDAEDLVGDGQDTNCDGVDGVDADGDGQASVESGGKDCNDANPGVLSSCEGKDCGDDGCGGSCGTCSTGKSCQAGQCEVVCGDGQCDATETKCGCPTDCGTCAGCCAGTVCNSGTSNSSCGKNGAMCQSCSGGDICTDGFCGADCGDGSCNGSETKCGCPTDCGTCAGCCAGTVCKPGTATGECGKAGAACAACSDGKTCQNQACHYWCGDGVCALSGGEDKCNCPGDCTGGCAGCCAETVCKSGNTLGFCGLGGEACDQCTGGEACQAGDCVCTPGVSTGKKTNGPNGTVWVEIPAGCFMMGCSPGDTDCFSNENPSHSVTLSGFDILETEVTEAQYLAVTGDDPSCDYGAGGGPDSPVECVDWYEAKAFCDAVGGRLCTEAEWEYAARGGTTTKYYCGNSSGCLDGIAWYSSNSGGHKHNVKGKSPNAYGLYDMLGNVWEWTADWYSSSYYSGSPANNPQGPNSGSARVLRGGSFDVDVGTLRVSVRPGYHAPSYYFDFLGLRCCRSE